MVCSVFVAVVRLFCLRVSVNVGIVVNVGCIVGVSCASLARKIILRREAVGWSQAELARRSGIRVETLCRIETGKSTPTIASIEKIDRALKEAEKRGGDGM